MARAEGDIRRHQQQYRQQLAQCDRDLAKWEQAYLGEVLTIEEFRDKKAEIATRRQGTEEALMRLDRHAQALAQAGDVAASLTTYGTGVAAQLQDFSLAERQLAIQALDIRVQWRHGQDPEITGSIPLCIDFPTL